MDPKQCFFGNHCCGIIVVESRGHSGTTVPRGTVVPECLWSLNVLLSAGLMHLGWRPAVLKFRLLAAELRYLGLGTYADTQQSWNSDYWQLGLGTWAARLTPSNPGIQAIGSWA